MYGEISERVDALRLKFSNYGIDRYGVSRPALRGLLTPLAYLYRYYFRVQTEGLEHVPSEGRAMIVGNHSGGIALDGAMVMTSLMLEKTPPRLAHAMVETSVGRWPFIGTLFGRFGQLPGLPEHAQRLLEDDRLLMVFPEGARGTAKLYWQRYSLVRFGTGFMRLALQTKTPIVPVAFIGGGEAIPTLVNLEQLGRRLGAPYVPLTPYLLPLPLPARCKIVYGPALHFEGDGNEADAVIHRHVERVQHTISELITQGRRGWQPFGKARQEDSAKETS
jgi:1-acyl-sn-glycerol-3-phosphate acyltransferase